jgi:hypothetical protein
MKTARDIIDGTFQALYRDARKDGQTAGDPFADVTWARRVAYTPDPFTEAERDTLCAFRRASVGDAPLATHPSAVASATPRRHVVREARPVVGRDDLVRLLPPVPGTASFQTSSAFVPAGSSKR